MAVTRAEVAKRAGVSPAVVSYVLNPGTRSVSAAARARVEEAIETLGYRPNLLAQSLRRSTSQTIGLLIPDLQGPSTADLTRALENLAFDLGYVLLIATTGFNPAHEERYLHSFVDRRVDGLMMIGHEPSSALRQIAAEGTPVIVGGAVSPGIGISSVKPEPTLSSAEAVNHLIEVHGHRRIGCVSGSEGLQVLTQRSLGWRSALEHAGLPSDDTLLRYSDQVTEDAGFSATESLLAQTDPPTAVFYTSESHTLGGATAMMRRGLQIGRDVGMVAYGGSTAISNSLITLTTVNAHLDAIARMMMTRMLEKIGAGISPETHDLMPADLIIGNSCGCTATTVCAF